MKCSKYPDRDAAGVCAYSGKPYCAEELVEVQGKMYAKDNLSAVMAEVKEKSSASPNPMVFMNAGGGGGGAASAAAAVAAPSGLPLGTKSKGTAILLALFLGGLGAHKFYLGQTLWGVIYLLFCWTFVPSLIAFIEALNYLFMSPATFYRRYG